MPESAAKRQVQKQLCSGEVFLHYLGVEIERYERYKRAFTLVLIQPPPSDDHVARLQIVRAASDKALGLLRTCDLVGMFDSSAFGVALVPETGADGARTVFDRFDEQMIQPGAGWTLKMATYPEHATSIEYFLDKFTALLGVSNVAPDTAETDGQLYHSTNDVSSNWRDLTGKKGSAPAGLPPSLSG